MPRKIRITLAIIFWLLITAMFLDFTGTLHHWLGWMAKIQFLPAVLALNTIVVIGLVALTLLMHTHPTHIHTHTHIYACIN